MTEPMTQKEFAEHAGARCPQCRTGCFGGFGGEGICACFNCGARWELQYGPRPIEGYRLLTEVAYVPKEKDGQD